MARIEASRSTINRCGIRPGWQTARDAGRPSSLKHLLQPKCSVDHGPNLQVCLMLALGSYKHVVYGSVTRCFPINSPSISVRSETGYGFCR
jgi:hypothetical protein